jgi:hypothetical protein
MLITHQVAGGNDTSVIEPKWTPDNELLYIGDKTGWWNLYLVAPSGEHINLRAVDKELGGAHWIFANYYYDVDPSGSGLVATTYDHVSLWFFNCVPCITVNGSTLV